MNLADSDRATPEAPSELIGPLPRKVSLNFDGDARYLLLAVVLFFIGGGIGLGWMIRQDILEYGQRAVLRSDGRVTVGTVTHPTRGYENYTFSIGGKEYRGKAHEPLFPSEFSHPKDQISIRFLPSNPAINHPDSWEWTPYVGIEYIALQGILWMMGGLALIVLCRARALARNGNVAEGAVTSCIRKDRLFHTEYEFRTAYGALVKGQIDRKGEYKTGTKVWVLYSARKPRWNELYPLSLFDVDG